MVTADIYLSDAALWEHYRDEHETVKIGLTAIVPRNAVPDSAVKVSDAEIAEYYQAHRDEFKRPRTAFLSYRGAARGLPPPPTPPPPAPGPTRPATRSWAGRRLPMWPAGSRPTAPAPSRVATSANGPEGAMDPAFDSAAFRLPLKTVSQPVLLPVRLSPDRDHQPQG